MPRAHGSFLAGAVGELAGVSGNTIGQWARWGYIRASQSDGDPHVYSVEDVAPVAQDVMRHFESQDFEVTETNIPTGGVQVSIRRGGTFKAIIGLKTALNIKIEPVANGTTVEAGVGIFGQQAVPTAITLLVFWPVIIAQVWNMAQEAHLDEEALRVAEESLKAHSSKAPSEATAE